jgi:hypothetical protein
MYNILLIYDLKSTISLKKMTGKVKKLVLDNFCQSKL